MTAEPTLSDRTAEIRVDPGTGVDLLYAPGRLLRPTSWRQTKVVAPCPFCPGNEDRTTPAVYTVPGEPTEDWRVRVVANLYPAVALSPAAEPPPESSPPDGERIGRTGGHDVVIECREHTLDFPHRRLDKQVEFLQAMRHRVGHWAAQPGIRYVSAFRNWGAAAGATQEHPHSQIVALPHVPLSVRAQLQTWASAGSDAARQRWDYERRSETRWVASRSGWLAFCPWASRVDFEVVLLADLTWRDGSLWPDYRTAELAELLSDVVWSLRAEFGSNLAYNIEWHFDRVRADVVTPLPHPPLWLRLVPRRVAIGGYEWATGGSISSVSPESAAARLRNHLERGSV